MLKDTYSTYRKSTPFPEPLPQNYYDFNTHYELIKETALSIFQTFFTYHCCVLSIINTLF